MGPVHCPAQLGLVCVVGRALVQDHSDVGSQETLVFHGRLGREEALTAVDVRLEEYAVFGDPLEPAQTEGLEPATVRENWAVPSHESVEVAHIADQLDAWPEHQVVGVGEENVGSQRRQVVRGEGLHRTQSSHRHERGRLDRTVGSLKYPGAGASIYGVNLKMAGHYGQKAILSKSICARV